MYFISLIKHIFYSQLYILFSNQMEQLRNLEDNHDNYLFDHLTVSPYLGAIFECPSNPTCVTTDPYTKHIYVGEQFHKIMRVFVFSESEIWYRQV